MLQALDTDRIPHYNMYLPSLTRPGFSHARCYDLCVGERSLPMAMKRRSLTFFIVAIFLAWNVMTYVFLAYRPQGKDDPQDADGDRLNRKLAELQGKIRLQVRQHENILSQLENVRKDMQIDLKKLGEDKAKKFSQKTGAKLNTSLKVSPLKFIPGKTNLVPDSKRDLIPTPKPRVDVKPENIDITSVVIPVLVIACNRISVSRNLDQLIKYRPSKERFPIIVSQDCGHGPTADVIRNYGDQVIHIQQPDLSEIDLPKKEAKFKGYYKIARHYKWALNQVFENYEAVIIVEDDLDLSPDFFEYFAATFPILKSDATLWCVSAWNDNGKNSMVSDDPELLYRTDFFPGLGWMLEKSTWLELEDKWPKTFWDDWMRHPEQRKERACIRPEISRTSTFGKVGVSKGQFYEKHLKFIKLNKVPVTFTEKDLSYLMQENYDEYFVKEVYSAPLLAIHEAVRGQKPGETVRVQYEDKQGFKTMAKQLGIMDDLKSGVPRAGYRGVVSFIHKGRRIYLAPSPDWKGYDPTWS